MGVVVIAGTTKGGALLRADAARERWSIDALRFKGWRVTAAARDTRGRYYVAVASDIYGPAVLVSQDLSSWRQLDSAPRYEPTDAGNELHHRFTGAADPLGQFEGPQRHVDQIWKLHAVGGLIYAGVSEAGLFRSEDGGGSWQPVRGLNEHPTRERWNPGFGGLCAHTVLVDARRPERIWVGISAAGVFRSDDGGTSWAAKNDGVSEAEGFCVHSLAHDPERADVIYRQDHRGMYRTRDGGDSWQPIETGLPLATLSDDRRCAFGFPIEMDRASSSVYAVPLEGDNLRYPHGGKLCVYRTRDGGEHWEALSRGLPEASYANVLRGAMAVDALEPAGVYFGTTSGTLYASRDRGDSWSPIPCTLPRILCVEAFEA